MTAANGTESAMELVRKHVYHIPRDFPSPVNAVVCGSESRVRMIGDEFLEGATRVEGGRFFGLTGKYNGTGVAVFSHGIGGPSATLALQELFALGARRFVRVGTGGALQNGLEPGDRVIVTGAVRDESASSSVAPPGYPAVPTWRMLAALMGTSGEAGGPGRTVAGLAHTKDDFFLEVPSLNPDPEGVRARWRELAALGVLISSMECAALFVRVRWLGGLTGETVEAGSVLVSAGSCGGDQPYASGEAALEAVGAGERVAARLALDALASME